MGFRLAERLREALLELAWWEQPMEWLREHGAFFALDLGDYKGLALERVRELMERKAG
jgi:virginiamycin A acetyltransferase